MNDIQGDQQSRGTFITGGYQQAPTPALPPVLEVEHGTIYQDETGALWKAINRDGMFSPRWLPATTVTAAEHRATRRGAWLWLILAVAIALLGVVLTVTAGMTSPVFFFLALAALFATGACYWRSHRLELRARTHIVAPESL